MLLKIVTKGLVYVKFYSIHKVMDGCMQKLLMFKLKWLSTLTLNVFLHGADEHIIGMHEDMRKKNSLKKHSSYVLQVCMLW